MTFFANLSVSEDVRLTPDTVVEFTKSVAGLPSLKLLEWVFVRFSNSCFLESESRIDKFSGIDLGDETIIVESFLKLDLAKMKLG